MFTKVDLLVSHVTFSSFLITTAAWNSNADEKCCPKLLQWKLLVFLNYCAKSCPLWSCFLQDDLCLKVIPTDFSSTDHETIIML